MNNKEMDIVVSDTHSIDPSGRQGMGALRNGTAYPVKCSVGLVAVATSGRVPDGVTPVFAVIEHPQHGYIAVSKAEFIACGLPEVAGFDFLSELQDETP